jgi:ribonucleoside-diphosphate reductase alpha chain
MPEQLRYLVNEAWDSWTEALELGEKYGYRNAQVTVLAPTGTIAFLMDCDTTGIEPDIALVKYKVLAGGGMLKIVNRSVPFALKSIGYTDSQINEIISYVDKNDTIEGSPIKEEHLSVFDCAFRAAKGKRFIQYRAHILMMSAVQPFISGSISKTINMPEQATADEIGDAYVYAWEQGLKAVAIYRENSKRAQPLNTQKTENEMVKKQKEVVVLGARLKLPQTRRSMTHKFEIMGHEGYLTVGLYDDGKPGEVFITMSKEGSTIRGLMDAWATSVSLNLQYGARINDLFGKFRHQKFEPSGFVKNTGGGSLDKEVVSIKSASSIVDYVAQFMLNNFGESAKKVEIRVPDLEPLKETQKEISDFGNEGLTCPHCGGPAKRTGNCSIFCTSCKQTTRSGCGE